jgi:hypothetical protein
VCEGEREREGRERMRDALIFQMINNKVRAIQQTHPAAI